ncbi:hypothetical protein [Agrococcus sp. Marseille-Q4369]|uniref:hypothetical protein n=1 Tax=Agrococcus sp. Marseille-Q4369 TaxID=2810513 RepID=UPI001B8AD7AD|nr:hypothetical protein [Agrococcus sp. Marseille-Q4369]QUW18042.1 hypothetical protein JSQ78_09300 [Agrococcus sp. Marseille-Q4369]
MNTATSARVARRGTSPLSNATLVRQVRGMSNEELQRAIKNRKGQSAAEREAIAAASRRERAAARSARLRSL